MSTILHAVLGYILLTLVVRVLARRPGAQMTLAEFALIFLLGGVIILSTVGKDRSMTNCVCAAITVGCMHRLISRLTVRFPRVARWLDGVPLALVRKGEWQQKMADKMNVDRDDVMAAARLNGVERMEQIEYAIFERNGGISIIKREEESR